MSPPPFRRVVIAGGGKVGQLFARELQSAFGCYVTLIDPGAGVTVAGPFELVRQDVLQPTPVLRRLLADADLVMLATPERVAAEAVEGLAGLLGADALLVETLSVKSPFAAALGKADVSFEVLGVNPMFAPDLGIRGNGIVVVPYAARARSESFIGFLASVGARTVRMTSEAHDRAVAVMQAGTHAALLAFGIALAKCRYDIATIEPVMTPPHRVLLAMLARLVRSDPLISRDIQCANPFAGDARDELGKAHASLEKIVAADDARSFERLFETIRGLMPEEGAASAQLCARLFASLNDQ